MATKAQSSEPPLSDPGKLLLTTLKLIDSLVPEVAVIIDDKQPGEPYSAQAEDKARQAIQTVLLGLMTR